MSDNTTPQTNTTTATDARTQTETGTASVPDRQVETGSAVETVSGAGPQGADFDSLRARSLTRLADGLGGALWLYYTGRSDATEVDEWTLEGLAGFFEELGLDTEALAEMIGRAEADLNTLLLRRDDGSARLVRTPLSALR